MEENNSLKLFENRNIRVQWNAEQEEWYFSVVDIVAVLTGSDYQTGRKYWKTLKMRLNQEGSELVTNCYQLKMKANDGKLRDTEPFSGTITSQAAYSATISANEMNIRERDLHDNSLDNPGCTNTAPG